MLAHDQAEGARVAERAPHHLAVGDREAVVGEADRAGLGQHAHLGELPPFQPLGHGTNRIDLDPLGLARAALHELDQRHVVDHGLGVGHAGDAGHPARCRREAACGNSLLVLVAGLAEVHVHVDEAGCHAVAAAIDRGDPLRHAVGEEFRPEVGDRAVLREQRTGAVEPAFRVQQAGVDVGGGRLRDHGRFSASEDRRRAEISAQGFEAALAHGDAELDLIEDGAPRDVVGDFAVDLHTTVHRPRMEDQRLLPGLGELRPVEAKEVEVLSGGRHEGALHALLLQAQHHDDVAAR